MCIPCLMAVTARQILKNCSMNVCLLEAIPNSCFYFPTNDNNNMADAQPQICLWGADTIVNISSIYFV
jgi:hypothetical protein